MEFTQDRLRKQIADLQREVDDLNEAKSERVAAEVALLGIGLVVGFVLGLWAAGIVD
jgi:hypothetical protein